MYHDFYQLKENPFNVTADPHFFFSSRSHHETLANLNYGIEQRKGIMVVVGEVGTGKTLICRQLLTQAHKKLKFAYIINPNFSDFELLQMIAHDLGIRVREKNAFGILTTINKFLIRQASKRRNIVLLIDEAQNLSVPQLEQIRLLTNLETNKEKLLQIILLGQPELEEKLSLTELRQLRQRVGIFLRLSTLEKDDLKTYMQHRINKGMKNPHLSKGIIFTEQAIEAIYKYTQGTPRKINILCDRALLSGFVAETHLIDEYIINSCAKEVLYIEHHL